MSPEQYVELEQLHMAEEIGRIGSYLLDLRSGTFQWTQGFYRLLEIDTDLPASMELFLTLVPPEDMAAFRARAEADLASGQPYTREYRLLVGIPRREMWVRAKARPTTLNRRAVMVGVLKDITEARDQAHQLQVLNRALTSTVDRQQELIDLLNEASRWKHASDWVPPQA